jgi:hypothetical protein
MPAPLTHTLRSRGFALCVHLGLWLLLYLVVCRLGGKGPEFREANSFSLPIQCPAPVNRLEPLFSAGPDSALTAATNAFDPFFTTHFVPAAARPTVPATTRKIPATYLGYYETGAGARQALVKLADAIVRARMGAALATNWYVAAAEFQTLTLTNASAQTNLLRLNAQHPIEVPLP